MDAITSVLQELRRRMMVALPHRVVSDDFVDFKHRTREELLQGVVSFILPEITTADDWVSYAHPTIVAQIEVELRDGAPSNGERAEQKFAGELRAFLRNPGAGMPRIEVKKIKFSAQLEHPHHWAAFDCVIGPIDESTLLFDCNGQSAGEPPADVYPPTVREASFRGVNFNIDMSPHAPKAEHDKWLDDDYNTTQPDIKTRLEFDHE